MAQHARIEETVTTTFNPETLKPKKDTIVRTIVFFVSWINGALAFFGIPQLDIPEDTIAALFEAIYIIGSGIFAFIASVRAWWMDNSFTKAALVGDKTKEEVRQIDNFIEGEI